MGQLWEGFLSFLLDIQNIIPIIALELILQMLRLEMHCIGVASLASYEKTKFGADLGRKSRFLRRLCAFPYLPLI